MSRIITLLFVVILFELILGGGGRLIAWGAVSLRMILFGLALLTVGLQLLRKLKIPKEHWRLTVMFAVVLLIGVLVGVVREADQAFLWEDIKPLLYFFMLPFFGMAIREYSTVVLTAHIIKVGGIILSTFLIILLTLIHTGIVPFLDFYHAVIGTQEFFFRGELTFFYKGFIYICIAFLFVYFSEDKYKYFILMLLAMGILLSFTRGFLFAIFLTYAAYYVLKSSFIKVAFFGIFSLFIVWLGQDAIMRGSQAIDHLKNSQEKINPNPNLLGNRSYSDEGRLQQIKEVIDRIDFSSIVVGHGFGNGIPSRPIHMEISYVEIFHKQGLVGLAFWAYLFWVLYQKYKYATPGRLRDSFFLGALFVYFQSLTNQYINNPIGLTMILLSIICLDQLKKKDNPNLNFGVTPHNRVSRLFNSLKL